MDQDPIILTNPKDILFATCVKGIMKARKGYNTREDEIQAIQIFQKMNKTTEMIQEWCDYQIICFQEDADYYLSLKKNQAAFFKKLIAENNNLECSKILK